MVRLFIAICPSRKIVEKLIELQEMLKDLIVGRFTDMESIHITLQFIGPVKEKYRNTISANIRQSIQGISPFEVNYQSIGFFPTVNNPKSLWVSIHDVTHLLTQIAKSLRKANTKIAKRDNRNFTPHLTIARIKQIEKENVYKIIEKYESIDLGKDNVNEVCLVKSELGREGARYTIIERLELDK